MWFVLNLILNLNQTKLILYNLKPKLKDLSSATLEAMHVYNITCIIWLRRFPHISNKKSIKLELVSCNKSTPYRRDEWTKISRLWPPSYTIPPINWCVIFPHD